MTAQPVALNPLLTVPIDQLDGKEIFAHLPPNRCGEADRRYMAEVLDDGFGNRESAHMVGRFEAAFAEKFGATYAISHNSGTGTMLSCLLAAGVGPGDEVIVPAATMASTAMVVVEAGSVPVFTACWSCSITPLKAWGNHMVSQLGVTHLPPVARFEA